MKKKYALVVAAATLVVTLAVGGTLAYLNTTTQTVQNVFASNKKLSGNILLREPSWDGYSFEETTKKKNTDGTYTQTGEQPIGTTKDPEETGVLGIDQAQNYLPGDVVNKDPQVKNAGSGTDAVDAYVALRVEFYDGTGSDATEVNYNQFKDKFLTAAGIVFNSDNWLEVTSTKTDDKAKVFVYKSSATQAKVLSVGSITSAIFTSVPLSAALTEIPGTGLLPKFEIKVTAYAIQANNITPEKAISYLTQYASTGSYTIS